MWRYRSVHPTSHITCIEVFINLTMLIKVEDSLFVSKELMRATSAWGWLWTRDFILWKRTFIVRVLHLFLNMPLRSQTYLGSWLSH